MENYEEIIKYLRNGENTDDVFKHARKISESIERGVIKESPENFVIVFTELLKYVSEKDKKTFSNSFFRDLEKSTKEAYKKAVLKDFLNQYKTKTYVAMIFGKKFAEDFCDIDDPDAENLIKTLRDGQDQIDGNIEMLNEQFKKIIGVFQKNLKDDKTTVIVVTELVRLVAIFGNQKYRDSNMEIIHKLVTMVYSRDDLQDLLRKYETRKYIVMFFGEEMASVLCRDPKFTLKKLPNPQNVSEFLEKSGSSFENDLDRIIQNSWEVIAASFVTKLKLTEEGKIDRDPTLDREIEKFYRIRHLGSLISSYGARKHITAIYGYEKMLLLCSPILDEPNISTAEEFLRYIRFDDYFTANEDIVLRYIGFLLNAEELYTRSLTDEEKSVIILDKLLECITYFSYLNNSKEYRDFIKTRIDKIYRNKDAYESFLQKYDTETKIIRRF